MYTPVYSITSNPERISRMGTVQRTHDFGGYHSYLPMIPLYQQNPISYGEGEVAADVSVGLIQKVGSALKGWWQSGGKDWATELAQDQAQQRLTSSQTGPTPVASTSQSTSVITPKTQGSVPTVKMPTVVRPATTQPTTSPSVKKPIMVRPTVVPQAIPMGPQIAPKVFQSPVQERTFLEKVADNKFQILLGSSALLLGVILIQRRRR